MLPRVTSRKPNWPLSSARHRLGAKRLYRSRDVHSNQPIAVFSKLNCVLIGKEVSADTASRSTHGTYTVAKQEKISLKPILNQSVVFHDGTFLYLVSNLWIFCVLLFFLGGTCTTSRPFEDLPSITGK